jgi:hypothetical protein
MPSNTLALTPGTRLRTGGTTYEVTEAATFGAGVVPVVPQPTRLLKAFCESCGYTVRVTQRWVTKMGTPVCPGDGHGAMAIAPPKEKAEKVDAPAKRKRKTVDSALEAAREYVERYVDPQPEETSAIAEALAALPEPPQEAATVEGDNSPLAELLAAL